MLYLSEKTDNWNEGLNPELTSDMHGSVNRTVSRL